MTLPCLLLGLLSAPLAASPPSGFPASVTGTVVDLYRASSGALLYCTKEGDVGSIALDGTVDVLATAATAPFPAALAALVETAPGDLAVLDVFGEIWGMPGGATPVTHVYDDLYMINQATDMILDASGNFLIASATPSNQKQGLNWVNANGSRWSYYMVQHNPLFRPIQLAADPLNGNVLASDQELGGLLHEVETQDPTRSLCDLDVTTLYGFTGTNEDGDIAVEATGDALVIAGGTLWRWSRGSGSSSVVAAGFGQLRGLVIAPSSGSVPSASGWSAYLAEGALPTTIREVGNVGAPASQVVASLGVVPNKGQLKTFFGSLKTYELETDLAGNFLIGGDLFGASRSVRRVSVPSFAISVVAGEADGITGRIEGICVRPDGVIFAVDSDGKIYEIHENPKSVSVYWSDPANQISVAKDLALARNGDLYVADREAWGVGEVRVVHPDGSSETAFNTQGSRGVCADPTGPGLFTTEWVNTGFISKVTHWDFGSGTKSDLPGFQGFNLTNGPNWGDGDSVVDVDGFVYVVAEDDWTLVRWKPGRSGLERIGSMYLAHPSGVTIAPSLAPSATGWSLYVSEYDYLSEIPGVAAPAPEVVDPAAPPVGALAGYTSPALGVPRDLVPNPAGGLLLPTSTGALLRMQAGVVDVVADGSKGLAGDLRAAALRPNGHVLVANAEGTVWDLDPGAGWSASVVFADPGNELHDVRGLTVDGLGRPLLVERLTNRPASKLFLVDGGALELLAFTNRGQHAAIDPLTAEVWVSQVGHPDEPGGELLRVDALLDPPTVAGWQKGELYSQFQVGEQGGGLAFDSLGNVYVAESEVGRVTRVDRASGARTTVAGNYREPRSAVLAAGTPGVAGTSGTSLFVLDGYVVWETGVEGLPAPAAPASDPGLAPPADILAQGFATLGGTVSVRVGDPAFAGRVYVIFPSLEGHLPGLPLALLQDPTDPRIIASQPDLLWDSIGDPTVFPGFTGVLDGMGTNPPGSGMTFANVPGLLSDMWVDLHWVVIQAGARNYVARIGATTQVFMGE